ncbi:MULTISPECIES: DUF4124 domain-containing protein [unclassified Lysobacter]|uniref:DUF4124 domain-containing protein n=1 Tax=unclassified Lysobacter TaxID=2635362 RepID=UPI0006FA9F04|nr:MULTISPECIES: DUF4124 domain-containing protein [unclassified Lysobacter]KQZ57821.1 hypothetical protein ASD53_09460 [Lysobacter sp. Root559]KRC33973.1 hypothetical protein ASE10_13645 [Lysobacter sp. Root76]KRD69307.1 hypothetical protein ASE45_09085 [Lysobacter sp. Root96]
MPRLAILLLLCLLPAAAGAHNVYKCVARTGAVSYQSAPCAAATTARIWDATPEPPPDSVELQRREQAYRSGLTESRYLSRLAGTDRPGRARAYSIRLGGHGCEAARARRERKLAAAGMDRDYDLVSALNTAVFDACK